MPQGHLAAPNTKSGFSLEKTPVSTGFGLESGLSDNKMFVNWAQIPTRTWAGEKPCSTHWGMEPTGGPNVGCRSPPTLEVKGQENTSQQEARNAPVYCKKVCAR